MPAGGATDLQQKGHKCLRGIGYPLMVAAAFG